MTSVDSQIGSIKLRTNVDFAAVHRKLRLEHGLVVTEDEMSRTLADVDRDLEDCESEVTRLESEIHHLQSRAIFLRNQRQRLERYKRCLQSLGSPIRKLPTELLLRIFDSACEMNDLTSKKLRTMPTLAISGVCSSFRDLTKSYPGLWSCIRLMMDKTPREQLSFPLLDLYLESSQHSPLTVAIAGLLGAGLGAPQPHHLAICATLGTHHKRWKRLLVTNPGIAEVLLSQSFQNFPVLEELVFPSFFPSHLWLGSSLGLAHFKNAPKLHKLSLSEISHLGHGSSFDFQWKQLTMLKFTQLDEGLRHLFEMCSGIKELRFSQSPFVTHHIQLHPARAPSVEKLIISLWPKDSDDTSTADELFASLTCPSLTSLIIRGFRRRILPWSNTEVNAFIHRSSFHLTTLVIESIPLSDTDLIDLLCQLPSLCHFTFDDSSLPPGQSPLTSRLMQNLHSFPATTTSINPLALVPKLRTLDITFSGPDEPAEESFSDKEFVDMIASRWYPDTYASGYGLNTSGLESEITCLRSVVLRFTKRDVKEDIYRPLRHLEEAGMRVVVIGKTSISCALPYSFATIPRPVEVSDPSSSIPSSPKNHSAAPFTSSSHCCTTCLSYTFSSQKTLSRSCPRVVAAPRYSSAGRQRRRVVDWTRWRIGRGEVIAGDGAEVSLGSDVEFDFRG